MKDDDYINFEEDEIPKGKLVKRRKHRPIAPKVELTEELVEDLCDIVAAGNFRYTARCAYGIDRNQFRSWISKGGKQRTEYLEGTLDKKDLGLEYHLVIGLEAAESECHVTLIQDICTSGDPRVKLEFLRRRYGKLYATNPNAVVDDETQDEVKRNAEDILVEKLSKFIKSDD